MQAIIEKIKKYIKLEKKAMNLINSIMPVSNKKGVKLSVELNKLHHELTADIENSVIGWNTNTNTNEYAHNKTAVAKVIALFKSGLELTYSELNADGWAFDFKINNSDMQCWLSVDSDDIETFNVSSEFQQLVGYACSSSDMGCESVETPTEKDASLEIKELALKMGKELKYYTTGSLHEKWGVIEIDFKS